MAHKDIKINGYTIFQWIKDGQVKDVYAHAEIETILENCFERMEDLEEILSKREDLNMYEEQEVAHALAELTGKEVRTSDNSYNWSSDLSAEVNFTIVASDEDWVNCQGSEFIVLRVHQGGDVRGNYSDCRIYKYDSEDMYAFLDSSHVGIRFENDDCDEYTTGCRSEPLYQFNEDFVFYGVKQDGTILCKRKSDNKRFRAYFENRGLEGY